MTPINHPLCNDVLGRPAGMTEEECSDLHIARDEIDGIPYVWSFWQPSAEELEALNAGQPVALRVMGGTHPPLSVAVLKAPDPFDGHPELSLDEKAEQELPPDCRWECSEWPHPKFPEHMKSGPLPDVIWLRIHRVFRGGFQDEVTGWQSIDPNDQGQRGEASDAPSSSANL